MRRSSWGKLVKIVGGQHGRSGTQLARQQGTSRSNIFVLGLWRRYAEDRTQKPGWRPFRRKKRRGSDNLIFKLSARGPALVRHGMPNRDYSIQRRFFQFRKPTEGLTGPEERLGSLFSITVR
jgi:hypothetical protein